MRHVEVHSEVNSGPKFSKIGPKFSKTGTKLSKTGSKLSKTVVNTVINPVKRPCKPHTVVNTGLGPSNRPVFHTPRFSYDGLKQPYVHVPRTVLGRR